MTRTNGRLLVRIQDDGVGGADIAQGSRLQGLADRAEAERGTLWIESAAGRGTGVNAALPLDLA